MDTEAAFGSTSGYLHVADLASGGMGRVDLCLRRQGAFQRLYAVKRLHAHFRGDEDMRTMFLDEARVAGLVRHANVVSVLDVGDDEDGPFLVMDYVEGVSLSEFIRHHAQAEVSVPSTLCGSIVAQIARGLHAAHELVGADGRPLALVHRDVSPQNVLVGRDGLVRVTDFGISKALGRSSQTSTGLLKGKVGYMSPEQLRFEAVDRRSDLFALGIVFYELVTSRRLYRGGGTSEVARRILGEPPPDLGEDRPELPPAAVELCFRLLAKHPRARPATAAEVADTLEDAFALDEPVDVGGYVESRFGAQLAERRAEVHSALSQVERAAVPTEISALRGRPWPLLLAGAGVVSVVAAAGMVLRSPEAGPAVEAVAPEPAQLRAAQPQTVQLRVESHPAGAQVRVGPRVLGTTPMVAELPRDEETSVDLVLDGYEAQRHLVRGRADERIVVALRKAQVPEPTPASTPSHPTRRRKRRPARSRKPPEGAPPPKDEPLFRRFE